MHWKRAGAALIAAITLTVITAVPSGAQHTAVAPKAAVVNYGSGPWGGPSSTITRYGNPATASVLIVGDSITSGCIPDTVAAFKPTPIAIIAQAGQNTAGLAQLLVNLPAVPKRIVMATGSNDIFNPPVMTAQVARIRTWVEDTGSHLDWVDVRVQRPAYSLRDRYNSAWVNRQIYATAGSVIGWTKALEAAAGRGRPANYYVRDGVHLWPDPGPGHGDGCAFRAAVIAAAVQGTPR